MTTSLTKLANLVDRLAKKTEEDELEWTEPYQDVFQTLVGDTSIRVSVAYSEFDPDADPDYTVMLLDEGRVLDSVSDGDLSRYLSSSYKTMRRLYSGARRAARGVSDLADQLREALDKDDL
jgi:hypothetical protein